MSERPEEAPAPIPPAPPADESPFPLPPLDPLERGWILRRERHVATEEILDHEVDPEASPFALPPIEGLPFDRDSNEAAAIRRVIEEADRERARTTAPSETPPSVR
jgi:hypothetical protein